MVYMSSGVESTGGQTLIDRVGDFSGVFKTEGEETGLEEPVNRKEIGHTSYM